MLEVATDVVAGDWPEAVDWIALADRAARGGLAVTPHAGLERASYGVEVSVRLSDDAEVQTLNRDYRGKDAPTNVLSFPQVQPDLIESLANSDDGEALLGDIILAYETVAREAAEKNISVADHATHLIVHGLLHLLGYDHELGDADAEAMEAMERDALGRMGLADPYQQEVDL